MNTYTLIEFPDRVLLMCDTCGSLVKNSQLHDEFHADLKDKQELACFGF